MRSMRCAALLGLVAIAASKGSPGAITATCGLLSVLKGPAVKRLARRKTAG